MKFTLGWLKEHLDTKAPVGEIADRLTALGLEVESVTDRAAELADFVVGEVLEAGPHPDADRLKLCTVEAGNGPVRVVCGAPNARAGLKGVFAAPGTYIPGLGARLKKAKIRGVESAGMLCSARELELGDDHEGIIELALDARAGQPAAEALGLDDPAIDIAVTPNRGDCLGVHGIARDLAAAGVGELRPLLPAAAAPAIEDRIGIMLDFPEAARDACPHFLGRVIRNVRNGESPDWLKRRLAAVGLRPISALVDVTNFLTLDRGRPLHVFDADTVAGDLTVRLSSPGETLTALDGRTYELDDAACVIADEDGVLSLGGVMGGESSGCTEATTNVILEAALFDPVRTAATGRKLGIDSDARYRFERGVDPASTAPGIEAATRLILDICGGEAGPVVEAGAAPDLRREIVFSPSEVDRLGGVEMPVARARDILLGLGFEARQEEGGLRVTTPSWRRDVEGPADLVEEVLRVEGYDAIPAVPLARPAALSRPVETPAQRRTGFARRVLAARGLDEAVTYSFIARPHAELFGGGDKRLRLANPISSDLTDLRPSLLPALIDAARRNADRGMPDLGLFELGPAFADDTPEGQELVASGVRAGRTGPRHWAAPPREVDAFDAKADALAVLAECGAPVESLQTTTDAPGWYHPGRSGVLRLGPKNQLAHFGELHPRVLRAFDIEGPVVGFEVLLSAVPAPRGAASKTRPAFAPSPYPAVERDFAFVVADDVPAETLLRAVRSADRDLIADATVFDVYRGKGIPEGKVSLAVAVTLQPTGKTLTEDEIEAVAGKIVAAAEKAAGATLRG